MNNQLRKIALTLSGQTGIHLTSLAVLTGILIISNYSGQDIMAMLITITLIRFYYYLARGPKPILSAYLVRKNIRRVIQDELKVGIAFIAACFIFQWQVELLIVVAYLINNFICQTSIMNLSKLVLRKMSKVSKQSEKTAYKNQILVVGTGNRAKKAADTILDSPELETDIIGFLDYRKKGFWRFRDIPLIGHPDDVQKIIANFQVDALIIAVELEDLSQTRMLFNTSEQMGIPICFIPDIFASNISRSNPAYINGTPVLLYRAIPENQISLFAKNVFDKIGAFCGLILALPFIILTAIAIKLESKGPVFFKQIRSGLNGKTFKFYKFRTMCVDAEKKKESLQNLNEMSGPAFKIKNDPRITKVGHFLRKTSIDEIPQFLNVLKGDMSLVGPRPPLPKEVAQYQPWQHRKLSMKPGVTCIWQVGGRNNVDFEKWMQLDLRYIDNWSLWQDAKILAKTLPAVFKGSGAS